MRDREQGKAGEGSSQAYGGAKYKFFFVFIFFLFFVWSAAVLPHSFFLLEHRHSHVFEKRQQNARSREASLAVVTPITIKRHKRR